MAWTLYLQRRYKLPPSKRLAAFLAEGLTAFDKLPKGGEEKYLGQPTTLGDFVHGFFGVMFGDFPGVLLVYMEIFSGFYWYIWRFLVVHQLDH